MVDTWTGTYTFQRGEAPSCPMDTFCNALYNYCEEDGKIRGLEVVGIPNSADYWKNNKPITVTEYFVKNGEDITPIEYIAAEILEGYESYMQDESSNFGENGFFSSPWEADDLAVFTREFMIEWWS